MAADNISRSTSWNDKITNHGGKKLEEFIAGIILHFINEDNGRKAFESSRRKSNINLTITNNQMLGEVKKWDIPEEENASDHNLIKFSVRLNKHNREGKHYAEKTCRMKK